MPFKGDWARQIRPVIFAEGAQVFDTNCSTATGKLYWQGGDTDQGVDAKNVL